MARLLATVGARVDGVLYTSKGPKPASGRIIEGDSVTFGPSGTRVAFRGARAMVEGKFPTVRDASAIVFVSNGLGAARVGDPVMGDGFVGRITSVGQAVVYSE